MKILQEIHSKTIISHSCFYWSSGLNFFVVAILPTMLSTPVLVSVSGIDRLTAIFVAVGLVAASVTDGYRGERISHYLTFKTKKR